MSKTHRKKVRRNLLATGELKKMGSPRAAERMFGPDEAPPPYGTPATSVKRPFTSDEVEEMERSYNDFLELRRRRVEESVGRNSISDEPFVREE